MRASMVMTFIFHGTTLSLTITISLVAMVVTFTPVSVFTMATKSYSLTVTSIAMMKVMVTLTWPVVVLVTMGTFPVVTQPPIRMVLPQMMMATMGVFWVVLRGPTTHMFQCKLCRCWSYNCSHFRSIQVLVFKNFPKKEKSNRNTKPWFYGYISSKQYLYLYNVCSSNKTSESTWAVLWENLSFGICQTKGTDQLRSNHAADQHISFCYIDSTIPLLLKSKVQSLLPSNVAVRAWFVSDLVWLPGPGLTPLRQVFSWRSSLANQHLYQHKHRWDKQ